jgi:expansin (peptidoglycan-binding protein)
MTGWGSRRLRALGLGIAAALASIAAAAPAGADETGCPGRLANPAAQATYYDPGVSQNACSLPVGPGELITAVADEEFDGSAMCGRCLRVVGPEGEIVVRVVELCPSCDPGDLDLAADAFAQIEDPVAGVAAVSWETVECPVTGPIGLHVSSASNPFYLQIQVRDHRHGIAGLDVKPASGSTWTSLPRATDNQFNYVPGGQVSPPLDVRVTSVHGEQLIEQIASIVPGTTVPGTHQFTPCPEPPAGAAGVVGIACVAAGAGRRRTGRAP